MSLSFLVKILCYTCRPFTITLTFSAFICAGRCLSLTQINAKVARMMVIDLHVQQRILTRNDGDISLIR